MCISLSAGLFLLLIAPLAGFEVTRNVNSGQPPIERVLLFAKDRPHAHRLWRHRHRAAVVG